MQYFALAFARENPERDLHIPIAAMAEFFRDRHVAYSVQRLGPLHVIGAAPAYSQKRVDFAFPKSSYGKTILVGDLSLYNRDELAEWLTQKGIQPGDSDIDILCSYLAEKGVGAAAEAVGDFGLAFYCNERNTVTLIRDHMGIHPLYYCEFDGTIYVSNTPAPLHYIPGFLPTLNEKAAAWHLWRMTPGPFGTYHREIKAVPAGTGITFSQRLSVRETRFWEPRVPEEPPPVSDTDYFERISHELVRAVKSRVANPQSTAFMLSGGLDSSTVVGIAATHFPNIDFPCLSIVLPRSDSTGATDELKYQLSLMRRYPQLRHLLVDGTELPLTTGMEAAVVWRRQPLSSAMYFVSCAVSRKAAAAGARHLITGVGGDSCISVQGASYLRECLSRLDLNAAFKEAQRQHAETGRTVARLLAQEILTLGIPNLWHRIQRVRYWSRLGSRLVLNDRLLSELKRDPAFLAPGLFHSSTLQENIQHEIVASLQNDLLNDTNNVDYSLPYFTGVVHRHPLLDVRLLDVCLVASGEFHIRGPHRRMLIRHPADKYAGQDIAWRRDKGGMALNQATKFRKEKADIDALMHLGAKHPLWANIIDNRKLSLPPNPSDSVDIQQMRVMESAIRPATLAAFLAAEGGEQLTEK